MSFYLITLALLLAGPGYDEAASVVSQEPRLLDVAEHLNYPEGTNATITCSLGSGDLDRLTLDWFRDDRKIAPSLKYKLISVPDNVVSTLRVIDLKQEDSAVYSCVAKNSFGQDKISTRLDVKVQLKWLREPKGSIDVSAGKPVHVPCVASGQPPPRIEWIKLKTSGENQGAGSYEPTGRGSELRFNAIAQNDAGQYECRASNGVEKDLVARVRLNVLGKYRDSNKVL